VLPPKKQRNNGYLEQKEVEDLDVLPATVVKAGIEAQGQPKFHTNLKSGQELSCWP
jgi:hypothetical protein